MAGQARPGECDVSTRNKLRLKKDLTALTSHHSPHVTQALVLDCSCLPGSQHQPGIDIQRPLFMLTKRFPAKGYNLRLE